MFTMSKSNIICLKNIFYYQLVFICLVNIHNVCCWYEYKIHPLADGGTVLAKDENPKSQLKEHLSIPDHFELSGPGAGRKFAAYVHNIENVANKENFTVKYKVAVESSKGFKRPKRNRTHKLKLTKKTKTYNTPLKKESMKLSNFELLMKKLAEDNQSEQEISETVVDTLPYTTETWVNRITTKQIPSGKYKPIINTVKTNFKPKVAPVKSNIITLKTNSSLGVNILPYMG